MPDKPSAPLLRTSIYDDLPSLKMRHYSKAYAAYLSEEGRRLARLRWDKEQPKKELDADTLRKRALYDRKGMLLLGGIDIHYSTNRSDQFDVYVRGELVCTGGPRVIAEFITNHE